MIAFQLYSCENTYNDNSYKNSVVQAVYCIIQPISDLYNSFNFSASDLIAELFIISDFNTEPTWGRMWSLHIFHKISKLITSFSNTHSFLRFQSSHLQIKTIILMTWELMSSDINPITMVSREMIIRQCSDFQYIQLHCPKIFPLLGISQKGVQYFVTFHYIICKLHLIFSFVLTPIFNWNDSIEDFPIEIWDFSRYEFAIK